ncbi:MAG: GNAT family N-acetyltransferase [Anaerolineae bacterium]|nr:GNAT family N-acetyltransferase [Anaerolineae bacterium]NIN97543.1 GNAT family N-acetyltransferase [Anaerolineae bacterium]NIQ80471.1 GNAT family N-acetyltransferase [Anaerolineae bacterium]
MVSVREAQLRDLSGIGKLHRRASESQARLDPRLAPEPEDSERSAKALQTTVGGSSGIAFVAEESDTGALLGFATGKIVDNKPFAHPEFGHVSCLHVDEVCRGEGVGDSLWRAVDDWFRREGVAVAQVDVPHCNPILRRFWQDRGFSGFLDHLCCEARVELTKDDDTPVSVRGARSGDADSVLSLWEEMMDYHAPIDERLRVGANWRRHVARATWQWLTRSRTRLLVAEVGDDVVGFAVGGLVDSGLGLKPGLYGHIAHMCVNEQWRRRGVGRQLFASLRDSFVEWGVSSIHVYVSQFNSVSQHFWRSLGFEEYIERLWCDLAPRRS